MFRSPRNDEPPSGVGCAVTVLDLARCDDEDEITVRRGKSDVGLLYPGHRSVDVEIRRGLIRVLKPQIRQPGDFLVGEVSLGLGNARVDMAYLNGKFDGFEIKSESDNLRRLSRQVPDYSAVLDTVTIVTTPRHLDHAGALAPNWWGIYCAELRGMNFDFTPIRRPEPNPGTDMEARLQMMNFSESSAILRRVGIRGRSIPNTLAAQRALILAVVGEAKFNTMWLEALKSRLAPRAAASDVPAAARQQKRNDGQIQLHASVEDC